MIKRLLHHSFLKFCIVGGTGFFVNMGILYGLTESGLYYMASAIIAIVLTMVFCYTLNNYWTFGIRVKGFREYGKRLWKYAIISFIGDGLYFGLLVLLTEVFDLWYMVSAIGATFTISVFRYLVLRRLVWQPV